MEEKKKYSAVCLNVDVTRGPVDDKTLEALDSILKRRVQVVLNVGEADKTLALEYVIKYIMKELREKFETRFESLKNLAIMCNAGQTIVCTTGVSGEYFDDEEKYETKDMKENVLSYLEMPQSDIMGLDMESVEDISIAGRIDLEKLYPTICDQNPNRARTTKKLAIITNKIETTRPMVLRETNREFNDNFNVSGGIWDVFDKCGAVEIKDYEWELLDSNNPLKNLFMERDEQGRYKYSLETDNSHVLRGSRNVLSFLSS